MYFVVSDNQVKGLHSHVSSWPSTYTAFEATPELLAAYHAGCTVHDPVTHTFSKPPFTDIAVLRTAMLSAGNTFLNAWAQEKYYASLAELISFKDSLDETTAADANAGIVARDKMRADVLAYIANLPPLFSTSLEAAMDSIAKPAW